MKRHHPIKYSIGFLVIVAGFSLIVMLLWNWLIPSIFGLTSINFWQALGLLILSRLFFGGFGKFWLSHRMESQHRKNPIFEKWAEMNDEERKEFIKNRHQAFRRDFFNKNYPGDK